MDRVCSTLNIHLVQNKWSASSINALSSEVVLIEKKQIYNNNTTTTTINNWIHECRLMDRLDEGVQMPLVVDKSISEFHSTLIKPSGKLILTNKLINY